VTSSSPAAACEHDHRRTERQPHPNTPTAGGQVVDQQHHPGRAGDESDALGEASRGMGEDAGEGEPGQRGGGEVSGRDHRSREPGEHRPPGTVRPRRGRAGENEAARTPGAERYGRRHGMDEPDEARADVGARRVAERRVGRE
jgi:hypothetical protein